MTSLEDIDEIEALANGGISLSGTAFVGKGFLGTDVDFGEEHERGRVVVTSRQLVDIAEQLLQTGRAEISVPVGDDAPSIVKKVIGSTITLRFEPC